MAAKSVQSWRCPAMCKFATVFALVFVLSLFCSQFGVECRPQPRRNSDLAKLLEDSFPKMGKESGDYDYSSWTPVPVFRRRRWAFPFDVQEICPPGQKLHTSGLGCVPIESDGDDY